MLEGREGEREAAFVLVEAEAEADMVAEAGGLYVYGGRKRFSDEDSPSWGNWLLGYIMVDVGGRGGVGARLNL